MTFDPPRDRDAQRRVVSSFFDAQRRQDLGVLLSCWCEDGVMYTPYAPAPLPKERRGKSALSRTFKALFDGSDAIELSELRIIATEEPQLWLAQWAFTIRLRAGGSYVGHDIGTFVLRDGLIEEYTEYFNPIDCARSYGMDLS